MPASPSWPNCVPIAAEDIEALLAFAKSEQVDLTVVGPEGPLSMGIVDLFEKEGLRIFGAARNAAGSRPANPSPRTS